MKNLIIFILLGISANLFAGPCITSGRLGYESQALSACPQDIKIEIRSLTLAQGNITINNTTRHGAYFLVLWQGRKIDTPGILEEIPDLQIPYGDNPGCEYGDCPPNYLPNRLGKKACVIVAKDSFVGNHQDRILKIRTVLPDDPDSNARFGLKFVHTKKGGHDDSAHIMKVNNVFERGRKYIRTTLVRYRDHNPNITASNTEEIADIYCDITDGLTVKEFTRILTKTHVPFQCTETGYRSYLNWSRDQNIPERDIYNQDEFCPILVDGGPLVEGKINGKDVPELEVQHQMWGGGTKGLLIMRSSIAISIGYETIAK